MKETKTYQKSTKHYAPVHRHLSQRATITSQFTAAIEDQTNCQASTSPPLILDVVTFNVIIHLFSLNHPFRHFHHPQSIHFVNSTHQFFNVRGRHEHGRAHGEIWWRQTGRQHSVIPWPLQEEVQHGRHATLQQVGERQMGMTQKSTTQIWCHNAVMPLNPNLTPIC